MKYEVETVDNLSQRVDTIIESARSSGKESAPCALVLDLDHAAVMTQLYSEKHNHRKQKTGTPMFIAVELSAAKPQRVARAVKRPLLTRLCDIDRYPELVERAFSQEDAGFMDAFQRVFDLEREREVRAGTDPRELHGPRHDIESVFWVLLWAFLRAAPLAGGPVDEDAEKDLSAIGNVLLDHELGAECLRGLLRVMPPTSALHPVLETYGRLIEDMATYLSIPWHLYTKTVPELPRNHAHVAFRRLLLVEICKLSANDASGDVFFRKVPRPIRIPRFNIWELDYEPARSPGTGTVESFCSRGTKRGPDQRDFDDIDSDAPLLNKRPKLKRHEKPTLSASSDCGREINLLIEDAPATTSS